MTPTRITTTATQDSSTTELDWQIHDSRVVPGARFAKRGNVKLYRMFIL